jgi:DNA-binding transcriptional LysR family regulator
MSRNGRPDLDDLALLVLVDELGSIGQAAQRLGVSQPGLSRRLNRLERRLGLHLLHRNTTGTSLTESGRLVADWALELLAASDRFVSSVEALEREGTASVSVAVSMTIAEHYAPAWLADVHRRFPKLAISLIIRNSRDVARLVEEGTADIGFVESLTVPESLRRRRIGWDRLAVAVHPGHPWAITGEVTAAEVAAARPLVREVGSGTRETIEEALNAKGFRLDPEMVLPSNTALKSAGLAGIAPVIISAVPLTDEIAAGRLIRVRPVDFDLRRPLTAVWRRDQPLSGRARLIVEAARSARSSRPGRDSAP